MSKFKLKIADSETDHVPLALGVPLNRTMEISKGFYKDKGENHMATMVEMVDGMVSECETLEEVVSIAFSLGGYHEQEMRQREMIAGALEHAMESLAGNKPTAEA